MVRTQVWGGATGSRVVLLVANGALSDAIARAVGCQMCYGGVIILFFLIISNIINNFIITLHILLLCCIGYYWQIVLFSFYYSVSIFFVW